MIINFLSAICPTDINMLNTIMLNSGSFIISYIYINDLPKVSAFFTC